MPPGSMSPPAFPKLVYVLDENNCLQGGKYDYITELAVKCSAKRMYPRLYLRQKDAGDPQRQRLLPHGLPLLPDPWKDRGPASTNLRAASTRAWCSINLPQIGLIVRRGRKVRDEDEFWKLLDERLELCFEALMCRHNAP